MPVFLSTGSVMVKETVLMEVTNFLQQAVVRLHVKMLSISFLDTFAFIIS